MDSGEIAITLLCAIISAVVAFFLGEWRSRKRFAEELNILYGIYSNVTGIAKDLAATRTGQTRGEGYLKSISEKLDSLLREGEEHRKRVSTLLGVSYNLGEEKKATLHEGIGLGDEASPVKTPTTPQCASIRPFTTQWAACG